MFWTCSFAQIKIYPQQQTSLPSPASHCGPVVGVKERKRKINKQFGISILKLSCFLSIRGKEIWFLDHLSHATSAFLWLRWKNLHFFFLTAHRRNGKEGWSWAELYLRRCPLPVCNDEDGWKMMLLMRTEGSAALTWPACACADAAESDEASESRKKQPTYLFQKIIMM